MIIIIIIATLIFINTQYRDYKYQKFRVDYDRKIFEYDMWLLALGLYDDEHKINNNLKWNTPNKILYSFKPINIDTMISEKHREKLSYAGLSKEEYEKVLALKKRGKKLERLCKS